MKTKIQRAIDEFKRIQNTDISLKDMLYLNGVLAVLERIEAEPDSPSEPEQKPLNETKSIKRKSDRKTFPQGAGRKSDGNSFEDWMHDLKNSAIKHFGFKETNSFDAESWRHFYDDDYIPYAAIKEDLSNL